MTLTAMSPQIHSNQTLLAGNFFTLSQVRNTACPPHLHTHTHTFHNNIMYVHVCTYGTTRFIMQRKIRLQTAQKALYLTITVQLSDLF